MNKFGKTSLVITSLLLPLTVLMSGFVEWQLKNGNPNNVDITSDMAYLKQILGTALVSFAILWVLSAAAAIVGLKKDSNKEFSKLSLILLVVVTLFSILGGIVTNAAGDAEEAYKDRQREQFFEKLREGNN